MYIQEIFKLIEYLIDGDASDLIVVEDKMENSRVDLELAIERARLDAGLIGGDRFLLHRRELQGRRGRDRREAARLEAARDERVEHEVPRGLVVCAHAPGAVVLVQTALVGVPDRKSVVSGQRWSVRVEYGGRGSIK